MKERVMINIDSLTHEEYKKMDIMVRHHSS